MGCQQAKPQRNQQIVKQDKIYRASSTTHATTYLITEESGCEHISKEKKEVIHVDLSKQQEQQKKTSDKLQSNNVQKSQYNNTPEKYQKQQEKQLKYKYNLNLKEQIDDYNYDYLPSQQQQVIVKIYMKLSQSNLLDTNNCDLFPTFQPVINQTSKNPIKLQLKQNKLLQNRKIQQKNNNKKSF